MILCPCCSKYQFEECCNPILQNQTAPTALALMRSRYTAYHNGNAEYLYNTTHSKTKPTQDIIEIQNWAQENVWNKLEIVSVEHGKINDEQGIVEFKAYFTDKNDKSQSHHERSRFMKENGLWFYVDGVINPKEIVLNKKVSRNDACPCGSGKKYKKCCA